MIVVIALLITTYVLNIIDYIQTIYAIQLCGISVEANPIARLFFENNCAWVFKLIVMPIALIVIGLIIKVDKKQVWAACVLFICYCIVVLHNFIQLSQMGIFNFIYLEEQFMTTLSIICAAITTVSASVCVIACFIMKKIKNK